jgi:putative ABC transport system permease protein
MPDSIVGVREQCQKRIRFPTPNGAKAAFPLTSYVYHGNTVIYIEVRGEGAARMSGSPTEHPAPRWRRYLRFWRADLRADVDDELTFHLEMRRRDLEALGLPPELARARAEQTFGDVTAIRTACLTIDERRFRRAGRAEWVGDMWSDLRFAMRGLRKAPGFAAMAIACIALSVGVTTTIFTAVNAILIRPLPYPDADRLLAVYSQNIPRGYHGTNISYKDYASWRDENHTLSGLGIWTWVTKTLSEGETERVAGASVSANLFPTLGIRPLLGRNFLPEEERRGRGDVVLLSYGLWRRRFGGDSSIVGKMISMDSRPHLVVGVMPPNFNFPERGNFWMPFVFEASASEGRGDRGYAGAIGRLKPGVTLQAARADFQALSERLQHDFPTESTGWSTELKTMRDDLTGDLRTPLLVFLAAVGLVLLIGCANVANLMLARGTSRHREMAVRTALGAAHGRLVRQLFTESMLIAVLGGAIGAAVGVWAVRLFRFAFPNDVPFYFSLTADPRALAFAAGVTVLTGILFGTIPAVRTTRVDISNALRDGARGGEGRARVRLRGALVIGEVALSVVLMVSAMLLIRSYRAYTATNLGFDETGILTARIRLPEFRYDTSAKRIAFFEQLEARLRALPSVTRVGSADGIPVSGWDLQSEVNVFGRPSPPPNQELISHYQEVFPEFFSVMGIRLTRGRMLDDTDRDRAAPNGVINETFARDVFPGQDPIGKRVKFGSPNSGDPWITIVGVIRDYRHYRLPQPMGPALFMHYAVVTGRSQTLVMRTTARDPYSLVPSMRAALHELDPQIALFDVKTMQDAVSQSLWRQRLQSQVLGIFAALALVLAVVGIYGVISYTVAQRTREIGVRVALGAQRRSVLALVLRQGLGLIVSGILIGVVGALGLTRALTTLLYGVSATDVVTYVTVPVLLGGIALVATYFPAARATRVDPLAAIRAE